ncbi:hypothetical protein SmJEL517_g06158 [Synchytrium microbalum]|uniref:Pyridine nucleotide-disulfide oxidoreductase domain-containing protein 2 n=1 Tax=Synchytrium microbalum TaxID=1806994 RepID=A0A507BS75_9FUNG|nr:uncharacterized protein SmJEL517_g06158 [Synchytrium microbalum]TPX30231.1 hypothetical protein SmJEL517_g06158 [Synchytrium microbalum]
MASLAVASGRGRIHPARKILRLSLNHQAQRPSSSSVETFDSLIIGSGHNGLTCAAYLAKAGKKVLVLERRHLIGGAAVTEEVYPGHKVSRASYLLSLLRPQIIKELDLKRHGLKYFLRQTSSFTPISGTKDYLLLGMDASKNRQEISKFSTKDAEAYEVYEKWLGSLIKGLVPLLDLPPMDMRSTLKMWSLAMPLMKAFSPLGLAGMPETWELLTAPASKILKRFFESEPLLSTLATDAVIGAVVSPDTPGSGYVLLHHVMGELDGVSGAWAVVEGGMGAVSNAIASSATSYGAEIRTNAPVKRILLEAGKTIGVELESGQQIRAKSVLSNATPKVTFMDLLPADALSERDREAMKSISYESATTKINLALSELPNFSAIPNQSPNHIQPHHCTTIHMGCESLKSLNEAYVAALSSKPSPRPMIEMTIPSTVDTTLVPPGSGHHVATLFIQYTPYEYFNTADADTRKTAFLKTVINVIEEYVPSFGRTVLAADILTPPDLERVFGLTGGNIFHGAMSLDQLLVSRPTAYGPGGSRTAVKGLYLCGAGTHPGGGVMGSPGRLAALACIADH